MSTEQEITSRASNSNRTDPGWKYCLQVEEDDTNTVASSNCAKSSRKTNVTKKGPMDLVCREPETAIENRKKKKLRQMNIREVVDKEAASMVHQYIARFWYQAGLSFNLIKLKSFEKMVEEIGAYGQHLPIPSYHDIRVPLLNKELEYTTNLLKGHKERWRRHGCSIMLDVWTDRKQRTLINFLVNSPAGTMFVKSIDGSNFVKTGDKLFKLLDSLVEEIGEENVVQVITDNRINYDLVGKKLEKKRPHLYWTPSAAHCIDLMLKDIGKLPLIKKTIQRGISLIRFINSYSSTLSLLRPFTNKREFVRHVGTRFARSFLSLERLYKEKGNLRKMFTSEQWVENKLSKEAKVAEAAKTVLMPSFWKHVVFTLKVMTPLVRVLYLVDGERKPAMSYIYEAMKKAKETIMKSFNNNESKYKDVFSIIDDRWNCHLHMPLYAAGHFLNPELFYDNRQLEHDLEVTNGLYACIERLVPSKDVQIKILDELSLYKSRSGLLGHEFAELQRKTVAPAAWWGNYGLSAPNLQRLAIKILSLTCSSYGCERKSVFEQIHSKKRNKLDQKKLHDLIYVKYNQKLLEMHNFRDETDPISLNDIDECNEWLVGDMDDDDEHEGNDFVFNDGNPLDCATLYEASGIGEPRTYTRRITGKRKGPSSSVRSIDVRATKISKEGRTATSTSKGKERLIEDDEELEYEENYEEESLFNFDIEESGGEEEEGCASLDKEEDD